MNTIESEIIGTLVQNDKFESWWRSSPTLIKLIETELHITYMDFIPSEDEHFIKEADEALSQFIKIESSYKLQIAQSIFGNFVDYCSYVSESDIPEKMKGTTPLSIWNFIYPSEIFVNRRYHRDQDIYIVLACECEWEKEHGLQLVFKQGKKLTRVSDQDGHLTEADAYDKPDSEDKLLSKF